MQVLRKPKVLYSIQATGNGHISRAKELLPFLQKIAEVDVMLSGSNSTLNIDMPVRFRSKGLSLFYSTCGGLNYRQMWQHNSVRRALREAASLPVHQYDFVLNDFDFITAKACAKRRVASVHFGHQASFISEAVPRPEKRSMLGEWVLKNYSPATHHVGFHFRRYDAFIHPPVVKQFFIQTEPSNKEHVTVYLPAYQRHCLQHHFEKNADTHFHWFLAGTSSIERIKNITYYPVSTGLFNQSLLHCAGLITGGGFETPAEALYLDKKLMCIPIRAQYEQCCNAEALRAEGIMVLPTASGENFHSEIATWLAVEKPLYKQEACNAEALLHELLGTPVHRNACPEASLEELA